jgi:hypothetical protein
MGCGSLLVCDATRPFSTAQFATTRCASASSVAATPCTMGPTTSLAAPSTSDIHPLLQVSQNMRTVASRSPLCHSWRPDSLLQRSVSPRSAPDGMKSLSHSGQTCSLVILRSVAPQNRQGFATGRGYEKPSPVVSSRPAALGPDEHLLPLVENFDRRRQPVRIHSNDDAAPRRPPRLLLNHVGLAGHASIQGARAVACSLLLVKICQQAHSVARVRCLHRDMGDTSASGHG